MFTINLIRISRQNVYSKSRSASWYISRTRTKKGLPRTMATSRAKITITAISYSRYRYAMCNLTKTYSICRTHNERVKYNKSHQYTRKGLLKKIKRDLNV